MKPSKLLLASVVSLALLGAGCGASTGTTVTSPGASGSAGGSSAVGAPTDIPQYPGSSVTLNNGTAGLWILAMTTDDSAAQVLTWYETAFTGAGFKSYGGLDLKASARQYGKGDLSMMLSVIDKSQPAAGGKTIVKITRQTRPQ